MSLISEEAQQCIRNIELLTDTNVDLKHLSELDFNQMRRFVHTPKSGQQYPEDDDYYLQHYSQNKFIQDYMNKIDGFNKQFYDQEQNPFVKKTLKTFTQKQMVEVSPLRLAKKTYESK